jgi:hypothetical protein
MRLVTQMNVDGTGEYTNLVDQYGNLYRVSSRISHCS